MSKRICESPLDEALDEAGITAAVLAEWLGVTVSEVSRWRRRRVTPLPHTQKRIAEELVNAGVSWASPERLWPEEEA